MAAYYPGFEDSIGPQGPPGVGFKLTDDGNYDMNKKILKNVGEPIDLSDSVTKSYVENIQNDLKTSVENIKNNSLILKNDKFDAKNKIISNVKDPEEKDHAVNKNHLDYYCILWDKKKKVYYAHNQIISNVAKPVDSNDAVTKSYVDDIKSYIENEEYWATVSSFHENNQLVRFDMFSSNLLDKDFNLKDDMYMMITIFLMSRSSNSPVEAELQIGKQIKKQNIVTNFKYFTTGKKGDKIKLFLLSEEKLKPYLHIKKINFKSVEF